MTRQQIKEAIVPSYLFLCILLGGSQQAIWGSLVLQLLGLLIIGYAAISPADFVRTRRVTQLWLLALLVVALIALQLVPLPPGVWTRFPGRAPITAGFSLLHQPLPWLPISLSPIDTLGCLLFCMPPIAVLAGTLHVGAFSVRYSIWALMAATLLSVLIGFAQVISKSPAWYLYDNTNVGSAVGFFANRNHMGTLLVATIPFIAVLLSRRNSLDRSASASTKLIGGVAAVVILTGIAMNGSLAAVVLAVPVAILSCLLLPSSRLVRVLAGGLAASTFVIGLALLAASPVAAKLTGNETSSVTGRWDIWQTSFQAAAAYFPFGAGFGSFAQAFHPFEDAAGVTGTYVNNAHNDYLELTLNGGLVAVLLALSFFVWFSSTAAIVWRRKNALLPRAGVVTAAAMLGHSIVDYPLHTTALASLFAFCVAAMVRGRPVKDDAREPQMLRPTRHAVFG